MGTHRGATLMTENTSPNDVYKTILNQINQLYDGLENQESENVNVENSRKNAIDKLRLIQIDIEDELRILEKNAEWNTFTVAFYGETNAGKSTLIESLRILLKEQQKVSTHEQFDKYLHTFNQLIEKEIDSKKDLEQKMVQFEIDEHQIHLEIDKNLAETDFLINITADKISKMKDQINHLDKQIDMNQNLLFDYQIQLMQLKEIILQKMTSSFRDFVKINRNKLQEQDDVRVISSQSRDIETKIIFDENEKGRILNAINEENSEFEKQKKIFEIQKDILINNLNKLSDEKNQIISRRNTEIQNIQDLQKKTKENLVTLSDGEIMGDGGSDFTQDVTQYKFFVHGKSYQLLDVPGIEGKEEVVQSAIDKAVKKAHAVFYVSKKPSPPQKGNKDSLGTIEKISEQLSQHSEVYYIYNKPVKNPRQLTTPLINSNDEKSLADVDAEMSNVLGKNYVKHFYLSAYPAIISNGKFFEGRLNKDQEKFRKAFDKLDEVSKLSLVPKFSEWLTTQLVENIDLKIKKSNYKKITTVLDNTIKQVNKMNQEFISTRKETEVTFKSTKKQIEDAQKTLIRSLNNQVEIYIRKVSNDISNEIYKNIDKKISNNDVRKALEKYINEVNNNIKIEAIMKDPLDKFELEIKDIVSDYQKKIDDVIDKFINLKISNYDVKVDFQEKSKFKFIDIVIYNWKKFKGRILSSILPGPKGFLKTLDIIAMFLSLGKEFKDFFDYSYKMSQQKKSVDKAIDNYKIEVKKKLIEIVNEVSNETAKNIEEIELELDKINNQLDEYIDNFSKIQEEFNRLSSWLKIRD